MQMLEQIVLLLLVGLIYKLKGAWKVFLLELAHSLCVKRPILLFIIISAFLLDLLERNALLKTISAWRLFIIRCVPPFNSDSFKWNLFTIVNATNLQWSIDIDARCFELSRLL